MKLIVQAIFASLGIHLLYVIGALVVGYVKTINYKPEWLGTGSQMYSLQSEVAFGVAVSPWFFLITFPAVTLLCGGMLWFVKKMYRPKTNKAAQ